MWGCGVSKVLSWKLRTAAAYRTQPFTSEANRMVFLFELYEKYTADLFTKKKGK
jgi:hypothetical protein